MVAPARPSDARAVELSDAQYRAAVGAAAAVVVVLLASWRFGYEHELPPKPPKPEATIAGAREFSQAVERSAGAYAAYLERDSETFGLRLAPNVRDMSRVFAHRRDEPRRTSKPGDPPLRAAGLRLEVKVQRVAGGKHLVLAITNESDHFVAYRIDTRPTRGQRRCKGKRALEHNAIALAPRQTVVRTECTYRRGGALEIRAVETVQLPELGYLYVSGARPAVLGLDERTAAGHRPAAERMSCHMVATAAVQRGLESGRVTWRDLVDFYARHRCLTYHFPIGYEAFQRDGERSLPAVEAAR